MEYIPVVHFGTGFREWIVKCDNDPRQPADTQDFGCKVVLDADVPYVLKNGVCFDSRKGKVCADLVQLADGTRLLYTNQSADFR